MITLKNDNSDQSVSMNRKFKFRAWDKNHNKMIYIGSENTINRSTFSAGDIIDNFEDEDIMQYTGLKDINGIEIYEGDIFEVRLAVLPSNMRARQLVQFSDGMFHSGNMPIYLFDKNSLCIIGNIYQNSELLSEK